MTSIILPIQQNPFDRIFSYSKHYEFRKKLPLDTTEIYLYLSRVGIKGKLIISSVKFLSINNLMTMANLTESNSGFKLIDYYRYKEGYAATIAKRYIFSNPIQMPFVPQSYVYLNRYPELKLLLENAN